MKHYKFDKDRGIVDEADNQVLQLVGGTNKFRKLCGTLLVERLNVKARGDAAAQKVVDFVPTNGIIGTNHCNPVNGVHASWCTGHDLDVCPSCKGLKIVRNDDGLGSKVCPVCKNKLEKLRE
jgi:hypothetical protein